MQGISRLKKLRTISFNTLLLEHELHLCLEITISKSIVGNFGFEKVE